MRHLHLGLGRFHRAHQAYYLSRVGVPITAFSMRSPHEADALAAVGGRYVLRVLGEGPAHDVEISAIDEALFMGRDKARFLTLMADPAVTTVTLTVTEKGYCCDATGRLDLTNATLAESVIALLVEGLRARQAAHCGAIAILSCDNLSGNGRLLGGACRAFAAHAGLAFDGALVSFPNSMVDRIVPSGSSPLLVETEAFHQWVIEDRFLGGRPAWEQEGLMFVSQVEPFERLKLRLLNAAHSLCAYYGQLLGYDFVHEAVRDARVLELLERLFFVEVGPGLEVPAPLTLRDYGQALLRRFDNPALPHRLAQIAMDGSQKLPQRVLPGVVDSPVLALCLDAWFSYLWLGLRGDRDFAVSDPFADRFRASLEPTFEETVTRWLVILGWDAALANRKLLTE